MKKVNSVKTGSELRGKDLPKEYVLAAIILSCLGMLIRLYYLNLPIRYDEAFTYMHYARMPFKYALSDYSLPNNHIFHTLLVRCSILLFGPWEWAIRLPALVAGLCLMPAMFLLGRKLGGNDAGLWTLGLTAASSPLVEYSVNGRGYSMICLFTALLLLAAFRLLAGERRTADWALFIAAAVAGLYTIPIMLYPLAVVVIWLLWRNRFQVKAGENSILPALALSLLIISAGALLCYAPVIVNSGFYSLVDNRFVKPLPLKDFLAMLPGLGWDVYLYFTRDYPVVMSIMITICFILGFPRHKSLVITAFVTVLLLLTIQRANTDLRFFLFGLAVYLPVAASGVAVAQNRLLGKTAAGIRKASGLLLPVAWSLTGLLFIFSSVGSSIRADIFPEAERVAGLLNAGPEAYSFIISQVTVTEPVYYYGTGRGRTQVETELLDSDSQRALLVVDLRQQSTQEFMESNAGTLQLIGAPEYLTKIDSAEVYTATLMDMESFFKNRALNDAGIEREIEKLESRIDQSSFSASFWSIAGWFYIHLKEFPKASRIERLILKYDSNNLMALHCLGRIYHETQNIDSAEVYYKKVLLQNPRHVNTLVNMGILKKSQSQPDSALVYYHKALEIDSNNYEAIVNLGNFYYLSQNWEQAGSYFERAIKIKPESGKDHLALGMVCLQLPNGYPRALEEFKIAESLLPDMSEAIRLKYIEPLIDLAARNAEKK